MRTRPEEAYAEELVKLTVRTRVLDFMQVQFSSDTQDEVVHFFVDQEARGARRQCKDIARNTDVTCWEA